LRFGAVAIIVILPKLLDDLELFRCIVATALATDHHRRSGGVIRKITNKAMAAIPVVGTIALKRRTKTHKDTGQLSLSR
jgi:branched-chain amino acid transport system permease protein